jgi:REP element-mobilizing transposase RayT
MARQWLHVQWSTFGAWLPGDPRGFRNHQHRIHSSGDYRHPPPPGEHAGLHAYAKRVMHRDAVTLAPEVRELVRDAIVEKALALELDPRALAVCRSHVHLLASFEREKLSRSVGQLKRHASRRCTKRIPGTMWGARQHAVLVKDQDQFVAAVRYILEHRRQGGAVWARHVDGRG